MVAAFINGTWCWLFFAGGLYLSWEMLRYDRKQDYREEESRTGR